MGYTGRYTTGLLSHNFGGINRDASIVNLKNNQALEIVNFDIGQRGTIKRRSGWQQLSTVGDAVSPLAVALFAFPDIDGVYHYGAIAYNVGGNLVAYEAVSASGPWTACGGSVVWTESDASKYVGIPWKGKLYVVNGTDAPAVMEYGVNCKTLKAASLLGPPPTFTGLNTGVTAGAITGQDSYAIATVSARGKSNPANWIPAIIPGGAPYPTLSTGGAGEIDGVTRYFTLSWSAVPGALGYEIYVQEVGGATRGSYTGTLFYRVDYVPYGVTTWQDAANDPLLDSSGAIVTTNVTSDAYNTPTTWETEGYPTGGTILARGRDERLLLWRKETIYGSAVADPLDWWSQGNAMVFAVSGEGDVDIVAGKSLYDYLMLFSKRNCWVFTGSSPADISINKVIPVGCAGPHALIQAGADTYLLSQFGPTSFKRIMAGADIAAAHGWADKIKPVLFGETNPSMWSRAWAYNDLINSRVVWTLPAVEGTINSKAIVYQYDTDSFTSYDSYGFTHVVEVDYHHYALSEGTPNAVAEIHVGNTDNGTTIDATYKTGWFDWNSWEMTKRLVFVDVIASRENGNYTFNVQWDWDYGQYTSSAIVCTQSTTDGTTIDTTSTRSAEHRIYTDGVGNAVQLIFTTSAGDQAVEILGWRPDARGKGLRKV